MGYNVRDHTLKYWVAPFKGKESVAAYEGFALRSPTFATAQDVQHRRVVLKDHVPKVLKKPAVRVIVDPT
jgi:hypothetical protein